MQLHLLYMTCFLPRKIFNHGSLPNSSVYWNAFWKVKGNYQFLTSHQCAYLNSGKVSFICLYKIFYSCSERCPANTGMWDWEVLAVPSHSVLCVWRQLYLSSTIKIGYFSDFTFLLLPVLLERHRQKWPHQNWLKLSIYFMQPVSKDLLMTQSNVT